MNEFITNNPYTIVPIVLFAITVFSASIHILREYERGVIFQLGRFWKVT